MTAFMAFGYPEPPQKYPTDCSPKEPTYCAAVGGAVLVVQLVPSKVDAVFPPVVPLPSVMLPVASRIALLAIPTPLLAPLSATPKAVADDHIEPLNC